MGYALVVARFRAQRNYNNGAAMANVDALDHFIDYARSQSASCGSEPPPAEDHGGTHVVR
jgi:hypothetical protein